MDTLILGNLLLVVKVSLKQDGILNLLRRSIVLYVVHSIAPLVRECKFVSDD